MPVGLPLPPTLGKVRVALSIQPGVACHTMAGLALSDARDVAPAPWRGTVDAVLSLGRSLGTAPRVFGALLWQTLTGIAYLHVASDLDLLWQMEDATALPQLLEGLARIDATAPVRIDGEVLTALGAINWRELALAQRDAGGVVLTKSIDRAGLVPATRIFAGSVASCC